MPTTDEYRRTIPAGTVIFHEGETGNCAYVIERGTVEISTQVGSEKMVIARRVAGEIFGEMAVVDNRPRSATVTAVTECELLILSAEQLHARLNRLDPVLRMVLTVILERFRDTMQRFKSEAIGNLIPYQPTSTQGIESQLQAHKEAIERLELEQSLKKAIARKELVLHYQPLICCKTGRIKSFEALVRWQHPNHGMVPPGAFIAAAEQSGLICDISRYVIDKACESLTMLRTEAQAMGTAEDLSISVNVTAREFADEGFLDYILSCLERHNTAPESLSLEITESMLMKNAEVTLRTLKRCRDIGLSISIDDFGTGYSSFSHLHRFPVNTLKIDRSFVAENLGEASGKEMVRAMIALGHGLGLEVVAEGIEHPHQASVLQLFGCDYFQGYLFSKPVSFDAAMALVREWRGDEEQAFQVANSLRDNIRAAG